MNRGAVDHRLNTLSPALRLPVSRLAGKVNHMNAIDEVYGSQDNKRQPQGFSYAHQPAG